MAPPPDQTWPGDDVHFYPAWRGHLMARGCWCMPEFDLQPSGITFVRHGDPIC